jgi:hypothetical protein
MTVKVRQPSVNLREKITELEKPGGIAGRDILKAETPQEVFNYIGAGRKNRIINGDMRIDQRNAGAAVTTGTYSYAADRFFIANQCDGAFSLQQVTDAPTEFTNSLKVTVTTADTSLSSAQRFVINHGLEGFNMADLAYGTANAKTTTLSFWVKSSVTGSYSVSLRAGDAGAGAVYATSYVINTANTWEYKSITIAGSTIGTWPTTNACWAYLIFNLGIGSDYNITANTWVAGANGQGISSDTSLVGTVNATWQITGVQLEEGSVATPFERRLYGQELALCQRYCQQYGAGENGQTYFLVGHVWSTTLCQYAFVPRVPFRTTPSVTTNGTIVNLSANTVITLSSIAVSANDYGNAMKVDGNMSSSSYTSGYSCALLINSSGAYIRFEAEI